MSDESLSQDEIDALLAGGDGGGANVNPLEIFSGALISTTGNQEQALAAAAGGTATLGKPSVTAGAPADLAETVVRVSCPLGDAGDHVYVISSEAGIAIAGASMGMDGVELDDAALNAIQEVFTQLVAPVSEGLNGKSGVSVTPGVVEVSSVAAAEVGLPAAAVTATYDLTIGEAFSGTLYEVFQKSFVDSFGTGGLAAAGGGMGDIMSGMMGGANVQSVQFPNLQGGRGNGDQGNISLLMDVFMEMTVELGRTKKLIREILSMGEGTIIELDKLAGEPVDILVNHKLIAKGEVVVIDENFGVRVTEIISPMERVADMT